MKVKSSPAYQFVPSDLSIRIETQRELDILFTALIAARLFFGSRHEDLAFELDSTLASLRMELKKLGAKEL